MITRRVKCLSPGLATKGRITACLGAHWGVLGTEWTRLVRQLAISNHRQGGVASFLGTPVYRLLCMELGEVVV